MKDPLALLSVEWLAGVFDMDVLVMVRHPAAFAASLKVKHWTFPFEDLANQPGFMRGLPARLTVEIREYAMHSPDIIDQAILLWRILHFEIDRYRQRHPDWLFVRHEDLARDPIRGFADLCLALGLSFTSRTERAVVASSTGPAVGEAEAASGILRDSRMSIETWRTRLSASEIERVREGVGGIGSRFYTDDEW